MKINLKSPNWYSSSVIHPLSESKFIFCSRSSLFCYTIDDLDGIQKGISFKVFDSKCTLVTVLEDSIIACASENGNGSLSLNLYGFQSLKPLNSSKVI